MYVCMCICICACMYVCMYMCVCLCVCACVRTQGYSTTLDEGLLQGYTLPICDAVTQFYRERFPNISTSTGRTDLFPGQVIEL